MTERRRQELLRMLRHEEMMRRPARELFPNTARRVKSVCKHCGDVYERPVTSGKTRGFCTERCRDRHALMRRSQEAA